MRARPAARWQAEPKITQTSVCAYNGMVVGGMRNLKQSNVCCEKPGARWQAEPNITQTTMCACNVRVSVVLKYVLRSIKR